MTDLQEEWELSQTICLEIHLLQTQKEKKKQGKLAEFCKKHPAARPLIIIAIILVLFFGSIGITSAIMNATNPKDVQIPNLVGKTEDEAKAELAKLKLEYVKNK